MDKGGEVPHRHPHVHSLVDRRGLRLRRPFLVVVLEDRLDLLQLQAPHVRIVPHEVRRQQVVVAVAVGSEGLQRLRQAPNLMQQVRRR